MSQVRVVHAVIEQDGKFLLGKRSLAKKNDGGCWAFIGGRAELSESIEDCLVRECHEEIGVEVKFIRKINEVCETQVTHYWLETKIISGIPKIANDEHLELRWLTKLEIEAISPVANKDIKIVRNF